MISVLTVPIERVKDGPYRNTDSPFKKGYFRTFENLVANLIDRAKAGHTLSIHVAQISDSYLVLDGHICADVYRYIGSKEVAVTLHDEITTETAAMEAYIAFNYLRADWRSSVTLMPALTHLANVNGFESAIKLMVDPDSVVDLIKLHAVRWWEFKQGEKSSSDEIVSRWRESFGKHVNTKILDAPLEDLTTNEKKVRGSPKMASCLIHWAESDQKRRKKDS